MKTEEVTVTSFPQFLQIPTKHLTHLIQQDVLACFIRKKKGVWAKKSGYFYITGLETLLRLKLLWQKYIRVFLKANQIGFCILLTLIFICLFAACSYFKFGKISEKKNSHGQMFLKFLKQKQTVDIFKDGFRGQVFSLCEDY